MNNHIQDKKAYVTGFILVVTAGLIWSFGAVVVKHIENGHDFVWQYLFLRGLTIASILSIYLAFKEGRKFKSNFKRAGMPGLIGGVCLAFAFIGFIFSITLVTAAMTLFMLAIMPFLTAMLAFLFLNEKLRGATIISMFIAFIGVFIMVQEEFFGDTLIGILMGLLSALGFAGFTVSLRWKAETPKFTTVIIAGVLCSSISLAILGIQNFDIYLSPANCFWSILHGILVASGMICYTSGTRNVPAGEAALLSLMEVVAGILWVWLPFFGINEVPSISTLIGGSFILLAIAYQSLGTRQKTMPSTT